MACLKLYILHLGFPECTIALLDTKVVHYSVYLTLGAHAHKDYSTHFVCVYMCVCPTFAAFK